jgi:pilus assembly protein Flp/PilA
VVAGGCLHEGNLERISEKKMKDFLIQFLKEEDGVTAIEYGLIAGLVAVVIIVALTAIGGNLKALFTTVCTQLVTAVTTSGGTTTVCPT